MFVVLRPSEVITNSFRPSLKATATERVKGWVSKEEGWSIGLKVHYQASILSKLVEAICSYFIALIFFYEERTRKSFFVGIMHTSRIFWMSMVEVRIDWIGERSVSTRVSWRSKLKTTGNILPGGSKCSWMDCFGTLIYPFSLRYSLCIGMDRS